MEPRAAVGVWDAATGRYTVHAGAGGLGRTQTGVAGALGVPESAVRVTAREVGGNFGTRNSCYPEFALVAWAARRLGRPVKWTGERREAFLADYQGRDLVVARRAGARRRRHLPGVSRARTRATSAPTPSRSTRSTRAWRSPPRSTAFPPCRVHGRAVLTNTSPTTPYRSAGRPEVMFVMERLIDLAARRHGFDRSSSGGATSCPRARCRTGTPSGSSTTAATTWPRWTERWSSPTGRGSRPAAPRRAGAAAIAASAWPTTSSSTPAFPRERAHITVRPEGRVDVVLGTLSSGQGHATSFAQLLVEWLGVELVRGAPGHRRHRRHRRGRRRAFGARAASRPRS